MRRCKECNGVLLLLGTFGCKCGTWERPNDPRPFEREDPQLFEALRGKGTELTTLRARVAELEAENKTLHQNWDAIAKDAVRVESEQAKTIKTLRAFVASVGKSFPSGSILSTRALRALAPDTDSEDKT